MSQINQIFIKHFVHFVKHKRHSSLTETLVGEKQLSIRTHQGQKSRKMVSYRSWRPPLSRSQWWGPVPGPAESMDALVPVRGLIHQHQGSSVVHPRRQNKDLRSPARKFLHNLGRAQRKYEWMSQHGVTDLPPNRNTVMGFCEILSFQVSYKLTELDKWCMKRLFNFKLIELST